MMDSAPRPVPHLPHGSTNSSGYRSRVYGKAPPPERRQVICWDMEGMSLSGQSSPQHPVLFGHSANVRNPLIGRRLATREMLRYIIDAGKAHPHAIHVGYAFRYDSNMLVQDLNERAIIRLHKRGSTVIPDSRFAVRYVPGKFFTVTERGPNWSRVNRRDCFSVTIYDFSTFFGTSSFMVAAEQILEGRIGERERAIIERGKAARGSLTSWEHVATIHEYWTDEITLMQRVFERFRDVMCQAGFPLKQWYGPGALANFINTQKHIHRHLRGAQTVHQVMPEAVHVASKIAFSGGRFELFQAGRVTGPVHAVDINSAYPFALTHIPSLDPDEGQWVRVERPTTIRRFGFYRIDYVHPDARAFELRPMPLFWRDTRGLISFPSRVRGWYASPEARMVANMPGVTIHEGWEWRSNEQIFPWSFLPEMYEQRRRIGKKNALSIPFKLGPNSLYGKYAQTVGWNRNKKLPPRSHALPVAAWITSYTRALLWGIIRQAPSNVVAVETDSVYLTRDPRELNVRLGDELGEWGHDVYDEIVYLQSGMYHYRQNGEWSGVRSRGMFRSEYPIDLAREYLRSLDPASSHWSELTLTTRPRFIGMGAALATKGALHESWCSWRTQERHIGFGNTGKRRHVPGACRACHDGATPWEKPHRLAIGSRSDGFTMSAPRRLPWEAKQTAEVQEIRDQISLEEDLL